MTLHGNLVEEHHAKAEKEQSKSQKQISTASNASSFTSKTQFSQSNKKIKPPGDQEDRALPTGLDLLAN
jgi:hypothetical protein